MKSIHLLHKFTAPMAAKSIFFDTNESLGRDFVRPGLHKNDQSLQNIYSI